MKPVSGKDFCKILEKKGWSLARINGSHQVKKVSRNSITKKLR